MSDTMFVLEKTAYEAPHKEQQEAPSIIWVQVFNFGN